MSVGFINGVLQALGITFNNGTDVLANYSSGSFSPTISFGGASVGVTYTDQIGQYRQIGNIVFFRIILTLSSKGSSTGSAAMGGFPVSALSAGAQNMPITSVGNFTYTGTNVAAYLDTSGTPGTVFSMVQIGPGGFSAIDDTNFANNSRFETNGFYFIS